MDAPTFAILSLATTTILVMFYSANELSKS